MLNKYGRSEDEESVAEPYRNQATVTPLRATNDRQMIREKPCKWHAR